MLRQHVATGAPADRPEITFQLDPPELGALRIRFLQTDGGVDVRIQVQNDATLTLLQTRGSEISQVLNSLEIPADRLIFEGMSNSGDDSQFLSSHDSPAERGSAFEHPGSSSRKGSTQRVARRQNVPGGVTASTLLSFRA
ncbi:MAG: flagellar hook-length control protein FliK [Planctomycetaceae bacterium]